MGSRKWRLASGILAAVLVISVFAAVPGQAADPTTIPSSTMVFEGTLTDNGDGSYTGTVAMIDEASTAFGDGVSGFDVYARNGAMATYDKLSSGSDYACGAVTLHDAYTTGGGWGSFYDPDVADWYNYQLRLDGDHWYLEYNANVGNDGILTGAVGDPMSGTVDWTNMYAAETGAGAYYTTPPTAESPGYALNNTCTGANDGTAAWDMDWSWGSEYIPLAFPGFAVTVEDLGGGNYRVTLTPAPAPAGVTPPGPVVNENTGESYGTIQAAIDDASPGDTINVAAGIYNEKVFVRQSVTLNGAQAGVDARGRTGVPESIISPTEAYAVVVQANNVTIDGFTITSPNLNTNADAAGIYVSDSIGEPGEGHTLLENIVVRNNIVESIGNPNRPLANGTCGIVVGPKTDGVEVYYNEIRNLALNNGDKWGWAPAGVMIWGQVTSACVAGEEAKNTNVHDNLVHDITNGISTTVPKGIDASMCTENTTIDNNEIYNVARAIQLHSWAGGTITIANNYLHGSNCIRGLQVAAANTTVTGNEITDCDTGIWAKPYDSPHYTDLHVDVHFNNIYNNINYGIEALTNTSTGQNVSVDATNNWWGDDSGPSGGVNDPVTGTPANGTGDAVSTNVHFDPWTGAKVESAESDDDLITGETVTNSDAGVSAENTGTGSTGVTVASYASNPGGETTFGVDGEDYFDVQVEDPSSLTQLTITICPAGEGHTLFFWDGTSWIAATPQSLVGGCIEFVASATSTPTLAQLGGTAMAVGTEGDVNNDGKVDVIDARICYQAGLGLISLTTNQQKICDVDNDGDVDKDDAVKIAKYSIGIIGSLASMPTGAAMAGLLFPFVFLGIGLFPGLRRQRKIFLTIALLGLMAFLLSSCVAWSPPYTSGTGLAVGATSVNVGGTTYVYITASEMPGGGLASLEATGSLTFDPSMIEVTGITGQNGFEILAYKIDNTNGKVRFAAVNPTAGVTRGEVVRLTVKGVGRGTSDLKLEKAKLTLGDASNTKITSFTVEDGSILVK